MRAKLTYLIIFLAFVVVAISRADVWPVGGGNDALFGVPGSSGAGSGDVVGPSSSVDGEIVLFDSTTGKLIKRASGTGLVKSTSGVFSAATLLNADVNASAAIDHSKMAALTASRVMVTDVSGVASASSVTATTLSYLDATSSIQTQLNGKLATGGNAATATALAANPTDCGANAYATGIDASGNLTCASITNAATTAASANTSSAIVARDASGNFSAGTITASLSGNATTATALAANPAACSAGQYVSDIAADGTLTCGTPSGGGGSDPSLLGNGSASAPTYSFTSDSNTGMFRSAADTIDFAVGGLQGPRIQNYGPGYPTLLLNPGSLNGGLVGIFFEGDTDGRNQLLYGGSLTADPYRFYHGSDGTYEAFESGGNLLFSGNDGVVTSTGSVSICGGGGAGASDGTCGVLVNSSGETHNLNTKSPASNATCTAGEMAWDASYLYACTATDTWKRVAITGGY